MKYPGSRCVRVPTRPFGVASVQLQGLCLRYNLLKIRSQTSSKGTFAQCNAPIGCCWPILKAWAPHRTTKRESKHMHMFVEVAVLREWKSGYTERHGCKREMPAKWPCM